MFLRTARTSDENTEFGPRFGSSDHDRRRPRNAFYERNARARRNANMERGVGGFFIVVLVLGVIGVNVANYSHTEVQSACVVTDKDRTTDKDGNSNMRVYTENCGVLQVKDDILRGSFTSADIYASIKADSTYDFTTVGFRFGWPLSWFPNITKVQKVQK